MTDRTLPGWIRYESDTDTLVIYGQRYSAGAFAHLGFGQVGHVFRVVKREADRALLLEHLDVAPASAARDYRKELWLGVATATASANDCKHLNTPVVFANWALEAFDKTFKENTT